VDAVYINWEVILIITMSKDTKEATKNYYDTTQISYNLVWMNKKNLAMHYGFWDKNIKNLHEALLNQNRITADALSIHKGDRVLDAGCGVGGSSIWIAENYGCKVTGISIVNKQIKLARKYAKNRKVDHLVNFFTKDYLKTDFENETFDKIFATESMCYANIKADFIREMFRILKPGGSLVISDVFLDGKIINHFDQSKLDDWMIGWAVPNIPSINVFRKDLVDNGFTISLDDNVKSRILPSAKRIYKIGRLFYPFDKFCNKIGLLSDTTFLSTVACVLQYNLFSKDIMQYHFIQVKKQE